MHDIWLCANKALLVTKGVRIFLCEKQPTFWIHRKCLLGWPLIYPWLWIRLSQTNFLILNSLPYRCLALPNVGASSFLYMYLMHLLGAFPQIHIILYQSRDPWERTKKTETETRCWRNIIDLNWPVHHRTETEQKEIWNKYSLWTVHIMEEPH